MSTVPFRLENFLLQRCRRLVPADLRAEWMRSWQGELWFEHRRTRHSLAMGLVRDALWLRADGCRRALSGTAFLCLTLLALFAAMAALPVVVYAIHSGDPLAFCGRMLPRFVVASVLTVFVSYATSFAGNTLPSSITGGPWLRAWTFHAAKAFFLLTMSALISVDLCLPLEATASFAALLLQLLCFVSLALLGLRWSHIDGQCRCRSCLRSLAPPQRVGRPSWNFLEYNGTELACRDGHGLLTVPELETSWCSSSAWIAQVS